MFHSEYESRLRSPSRATSSPGKSFLSGLPPVPSPNFTQSLFEDSHQSINSNNNNTSKLDNYGDRFIPMPVGLESHSKFSTFEACPVTPGSGGLDKQFHAEKQRDERNLAYNIILKNEILGMGTSSHLLADFASPVSPQTPASTPSSTLSQLSLTDDTTTHHHASGGILQYKTKKKGAMPVDSPYSLSPLSGDSQKLLASPRKPLRKIAKVPFKVLDAPAIMDDFYLNLIDWSSQNVLAVGLERSVYLWNAATSQVSKLCDYGEDNVTSVSWLQRGTHLAVGGNDGIVQIWDVTKRKKIRALQGHTSRVNAMDWNNHILSSGSRDKTILHHDVRDSAHYCARLQGHRNEICGLKWSPDGQQLASGGNDNLLSVWDAGVTTRPLHQFKFHNAAVKAIAWSPHQRNLLASGGGTHDKCIRFWNTASGAALNTIDTGSQICNLAWSKNVNELVSTHGYSQNQITVWSYPTMSEVATLTGHTTRVLYLAVSPDGQTIVTGAGDQTLRFWNTVYFSALPADLKESFKAYFEKHGSIVAKRFAKTVNYVIASSEAIEEGKYPISTAVTHDIPCIDFQVILKKIAKESKRPSKDHHTSTANTDVKSTPRSTPRKIAVSATPDISSSSQSLVLSSSTNQTTPFKPRSTALSTSSSSSSSSSSTITPYAQSVYSSTPEADPVISMLVPPSGGNHGGYQVSVFGVGFAPNPSFRIQFGTVMATNYEFHSNSAVLVTVPPGASIAIGNVNVRASNDGRTFGYPIAFHFYDDAIYKVPTPNEQDAVIVRAQLANIKRAIANIANVEALLVNRLASLTNEKMEQLFLMPESGASQAIAKADDESDGEYEFDSDSDSDSDSSDDADQDGANDARRRGEEFEEREIRIFISSPFRDMQADRDQIVKVVLPKIRKLCIERDIIMSYVDLRWGVTGAQSEQATGLAMCLKELSRCNLVIGMYGERYGWSSQERADPKTASLLTATLDKAASEYPWVNQLRDCSITEIEFRMVLDNHHHGIPKQALFYLRDPYYVEEVPAKDRNVFVSEGPRSKEKLDRLKAELIRSHKPSEYRRPSNLADTLTEDLEKYIDRRFPAGTSALGAFEKERFMHAVFAKHLCKLYIQNDGHYLAIDQFLAKGKNSTMVIHGDAGSGKSALLANWVRQHREHHPEDIVVSVWIGASPTSTKHTGCMLTIMRELKSLLERENKSSTETTSLFSTLSSQSSSWIPDIPDDQSSPEKIATEFSTFLAFIMTHPSLTGRRLIILLDGLNKLDARDSPAEMIWFPRNLPANLKVILSSTSTSRPIEVMRKRGATMHPLAPLGEAERKAMVRLYLARLAKKLSEQQELLIASSPSTSNPRFLQLLLDDIAVFGEHERLSERINRLLKARNTAELYEIILDRIETDYDVKGKGVVRDFLRYIWGGRRGIELEILTTLMSRRGIDPAEWSSLLVLMEAYVSSSSSLLSFMNDDIAAAVNKRYITSDKVRQDIHADIASQFEAADLTDRKIEELPYQLQHSGNWEALRACLVDLYMFDKLATPNHKGDLIAYWNTLEKEFKPPKNAAERNDPIAYNATREYKTLIARSFPQASGLVISDVLYAVATFLEELSQFEGAEAIYSKARELYLNNSQMIEAAKVDRAMGHMLHAKGSHEAADVKFRQALAIYTKERGAEDIEVAVTLNMLGSLASTRNKHADAKTMLNEAMRIAEIRGDANQLLISDIAYSLGTVHFVEEARKLDIAEEYFVKALEITELKLGDMDVAYARILNRLGSLYIEKDQFGDAESCFKMALKIYEARFGVEHSRVSQILRHMISLYEMQENYVAAEACAVRALAITKKIYGQAHFHVGAILTRLGLLYHSSGKTQQCLAILNEARALREKEFGAGHKHVQHIFDLIKNITAPTIPKPPPPPPKVAPPPPLPTIVRQPAPSISVPLGAGGIPIPPPPPPPGFCSTGGASQRPSLQDVMRSNPRSLAPGVVGWAAQPAVPVAIQPMGIPPPPPPHQYSHNPQMEKAQLEAMASQFAMLQAQQAAQQAAAQQQGYPPQQIQQMQQQQQQISQPQPQQQQQQQHKKQPALPQPEGNFGDMLIGYNQQNLRRAANIQDRSGASGAVQSLLGAKQNNKPSALNNKLYNMQEAKKMDLNEFFA
eukprot:gene13909-16409_t